MARSFVAAAFALAVGAAASVPTMQSASEGNVVSFHMALVAKVTYDYGGPTWQDPHMTDVKDMSLNPNATVKPCDGCRPYDGPDNITVSEESGSLVFHIPAYWGIGGWQYQHTSTCKLGDRAHGPLDEPYPSASWYSAYKNWTICKVGYVGEGIDLTYYLFVANVVITEAPSEIRRSNTTMEDMANNDAAAATTAPIVRQSFGAKVSREQGPFSEYVHPSRDPSDASAEAVVV